MVLQGSSDINLRRPRNKKKRLVDNSNLRPWSELPEALVHLITKQLGAIDYLMFGCVCKGWRSYVVVHRQEFMASQPPLVVFLSTLAKKSCHFYSIFDHRAYKATLPNLIGKSCYSLTCGYLVMEDRKKMGHSQIWLLNPFTRHELHFSCPPNRYTSVILASLATPLREFVIIANSCRYPSLQFCRSSDVNWTVYDYNDKFKGGATDDRRWFVDLVVFKGKIYVLTNLGEIGVLNLNSHSYVTLLEVKSIKAWSKSIELLAFDDQLLMIHRFEPGEQRENLVFALDFLKMEWVKMQNFGDQALFLGHRKSLGFSNITKWRDSRKSLNCIYNLGIPTDKYTIHCLGERYPQSTFQIIPRRRRCMNRMDDVCYCDDYCHYDDDCDLDDYSYFGVPLCKISIPEDPTDVQFWYFPHLSCNVDVLSDD
ncbi:F-box protein At3g56470-like [Fagus crenata]